MSVSLSASLKLPETSKTTEESPTLSVCAEIVPTVVGARFVPVAAATVAAIVCVAVKLPSLAVTVIVAFPAPTGVMVTCVFDTLAVTTAVLLELAV